MQEKEGERQKVLAGKSCMRSTSNTTERMSTVFQRQKLLRTILAAVCAVFLPVSAAWAVGSVQVTVENLNVRSGPSLQDPVLATLPAKSVLPVLDEQGDWLNVRLPDGRTGWVANWLVKPMAQQDAGPQAESQTDDLNVRSGPGQTFPVIQTIDPGTRYPIVQRSGQWLQIQLSPQKKGWVAGWLVNEYPAAKQGTATPGGVSGGQANDSAPATPPGGQATGSAPVTPPDGQPKQQGRELILDYAPYVYPVPDAAQPAIGQLHDGEIITVLAEQNGWIQFPYGGVNAWIPKKGTIQTPLPAEGTNQQNPHPPQPVPDTSAPATGSGSTGQPQSPVKRTATVQSDGLNLRGQASTTSPVLGTLKLGTSLTILEQQGDWYRVQTPDGKTGWVAGWLISVQQPALSGPYVTILNPDTNIRSGPGTQHGIVRRVQTGEKYAIVKKEGDWFRIALSDGTTGYVAGWLVAPEGMPPVIKGNELVGKVIVVDPGHGGNDNGATGASFSTLEKTVNLQVGLLLKNKLEAAGAKVIMTRSDDRKLTLQQRVDVAVQNNADIFVSIHHNTHPNTLTNGTIVFYYNKGNSSKLASLVQSEIVKATSYRDLQSRFGNYYVLRENPVPSILAEIGFLSNYNEEIRLRSEKQQDLAAEGLYKGILQYFASQNVQEG
jgi:N-acetylmuramoyl-L-alanine amidase